MARTKLDPKTLRWVSRKLRGWERQFRATRPNGRWDEAYYLGRVHSYAIGANTALVTARTIERQSKGKP